MQLALEAAAYVPIPHAVMMFAVVLGHANPAEQTVQLDCAPMEYVPAAHSIVCVVVVEGQANPAGQDVLQQQQR